jgi:hypothetical protein
MSLSIIISIIPLPTQPAYPINPTTSIASPPIAEQTPKRNKKEWYVPFDKFLTRPHFLKQYGIANNPRRILNLPARLIQPRNHPHNRALHDICQVRDAIEAHSPCPLVHNFDHAEARLGHEVVAVVRGEDNLVQGLDLVDFFGDFDYGGGAALERGGEGGFGVGFLLEDEAGEEGDDFFGRVVC